MILKKFNPLVWMALLLVMGLPVFGQTTKVMGVVTDAQTHAPIPFANVYFNGSTVGVTTGFEGEFSLETKQHSDTLVASFVGYKKQSAPVEANRFQYINFALQPANLELAEVVIVAGENPADIIMRKVFAHKASNQRNQLDYYQYEAYNKIEFDANNISEKFKNRRIMRPFKFIFDNVDTSAVNGKVFLPVFLSESLSDVYYRRNPRSQKEVIKASQVSGIDNESISQFTGDLFQNTQIYDNYLKLFQKNFASPVAGFGLSTYRYYLIDSTYIDGKWCYNIKFKPRRKQELTFVGDIWIHDTTFAVKQVKMKIAGDANLNYINDFVIEQDYDCLADTTWMLTRDKIVVDFNIVKESQTLGFFGTKTTTYRNFVFGEVKDKKFYSSPVNVIVEKDALEKDLDYWNQGRHTELSRNEKTIYQMVDTLQSLPVFHTYVDVIKMITTGYYEKGKLEIGPYMSLLSFNSHEGTRFRMGGRTSNNFSKKVMISGHLAYGTRDQELKYSAGVLHMLNKNPRRAIGASYQYDIEQLGQGSDAFREDFLLAALFRRNPANKLSMVKASHLYYEHEWFSGLMSTLHFKHRDLLSVGESPIFIFDGSELEPRMLNSIVTSEVSLDMRMAYKEKVVMGEFERISLGAKYPIVLLRYAYGIPGLLGSDYEYHKLQLFTTHWFNVLSLGWSKYKLEAGKIWGKLPYPLMKIHAGNETFWYSESSFNLMNYYEFVSDEYLRFFYTHHFDGFFLNRIPLMRRLKWREVAFAQGTIGRVSEKNQNAINETQGIHQLDKPYFEAGVGLENILKIFRIDAVWRLSHLDNPGANKFGLFMSMYFDF